MLKNYIGSVKKLLSYANTDVNCKDDQGKTLVCTAINNNLSKSVLEHIKFLLNEKVFFI